MKTKAWIITAAGIVGVTALLGGIKFFQISAAMAQFSTMPEPTETVSAVRPSLADWAPTSRAVGTVASFRAVDLRNELRGTVVDVGYESGDLVQKGQVLVRLDTSEEVAQLASARARSDLARVTLDRREKLEGGPAANKALLDAARAELAGARADVARLEAVIAKKTLTAPFAARVGIRDLQPGAFLSEGSVVARLEGVDPDAYIDFSFPQDVAAGLLIGSSVTVTAPGLPAGGVAGKVQARDAAVATATRTVRFRAVLPGLGGSLPAGTFVDVSAAVSASRKALFIPLVAVRRAPYGDHVWKIVDDKGVARVRQQFVRLGPISGDNVAVLEGLTAEERIAAQGSFKLREGLAVNLVETTVSAGAVAAPTPVVVK